MKRPRLPIAVRLILGLLLSVVLGTGLLLLPGMSTRPLAWNEAAFTAISALSVTGLSVITVGTDLTPMGQYALAALIQVGGIGYTVLAVIVLSLIGRTISLADRLALRDSLGLLSPEGILRLTRYVLVTVFTLEVVGATLLYFHWQGVVPDADRFRFAVFHAVSAFCNAGFDLFTGRPDLAGFPTDGGTLWTKGVLIVLGSIGIPVLFDLITWKRRFTLHSKLTLLVVGGLISLGAVGLFFAERGGVLEGMSNWRQWGLALFQSVSARSAGFAGLPSFESMSGASQLLLVWLMFIGGSPASMAGGITTGTFAVLTLSVVAYVRGQDTPTVFGRAIPGAMVRKAAAVLTVSIFVVVLSSFILLLTHDIPMATAVFESVSAFATCGLSLNFTSQLSVTGQVTLMFVMFWGRLGALTLIYALTQRQDARRVRYPEEKILIG